KNWRIKVFDITLAYFQLLFSDLNYRKQTGLKNFGIFVNLRIKM
ncbi:13695_t:CDS:1, partial [Racocetra persica]